MVIISKQSNQTIIDEIPFVKLMTSTNKLNYYLNIELYYTTTLTKLNLIKKANSIYLYTIWKMNGQLENIKIKQIKVTHRRQIQITMK